MIAKIAEGNMDRYILNTVDYDYKALNHEGFGGVCNEKGWTFKASCQARKHTVSLQHLYVQSAC